LEVAIRSQHPLGAIPGGRPPTPLELHRYFRAAGEAGLLAVLLHLADFLAGQPGLLDWRERLQVARAFLEAWFERHDQLVEPRPLLRGDELIAELGLQPGPAVGETLRRLAEAQVQGLIATRAQALEQARAVQAGVAQDPAEGPERG
jgi:hypothetical protein